MSHLAPQKFVTRGSREIDLHASMTETWVVDDPSKLEEEGWEIEIRMPQEEKVLSHNFNARSWRAQTPTKTRREPVER